MYAFAWMAFVGTCRAGGFLISFALPCGIDNIGGFEGAMVLLQQALIGCYMLWRGSGKTHGALKWTTAYSLLYAALDAMLALQMGNYMSCAVPGLQDWWLF